MNEVTAMHRTNLAQRPGPLLAAAFIMLAGCVESTPTATEDKKASAFDPDPASAPVYGISPPSDNPGAQVHYVTADDGTQIYVETWLPAPKDGAIPPARVPTVVFYGPYDVPGVPESYWIDVIVPHGYAFAQAHVRGFGGSGGCHDPYQPVQGEDGALVVQYLGRDAPWSNGVVGMFGQSYMGYTQLQTALAASGRQFPWLKEIAPLAPIVSLYDDHHHDGVPHLVRAAGDELVYGANAFGVLALSYGYVPANPLVFASRAGCPPSAYLAYTEPTEAGGDYDGIYPERDITRDLHRLRVPMLYVQGHRDGRVPAKSADGFFDRLPGGIVGVGIFGPFRHEPPDDFLQDSSDGPPRTDWERDDFRDTYLAWFDHWLLGVDTGVRQWPAAQVQDTEGRWRALDEWPHPRGTLGQLALSAGGALGAAEPTGSSSYVEAGLEAGDGTYPPGTSVVFETPPLAAPLEVIGMPVADLWIESNQPDGHIAAKLEAIGPDGTLTIREARTEGARSLQHLEALVDGAYFRQADPVVPAAGEPLHVVVRMNPTALIVPAGGRLRLTIAGSVQANDGVNYFRQDAGVPLPDTVGGPTALSGAQATITVLHDCAHPSLLSFTTRDRDARWLSVREKIEPGPGDRTPAPAVATGGGLATAAVCGSRPTQPVP